MDDLVDNQHYFLQVVEDHFSSVRTSCDEMQGLTDYIDDLFHQHEVLLITDNQEDLQLVNLLEENSVGVEGEDLSWIM